MRRLQLLKNYFLPVFLLTVSIFGAATIINAQEDGGEDRSGEAVALFNQGQDAHEKNDFAAAIKFYDEALKIIPEFPEAEFQRGAAFLSLRKFNDAEKAFRHALELREDWTLPMAQLGSLLVNRNKFDEAEKLLVKAAADDPQNFLAFSALTELRLKTNAAPEVLRELLSKIKLLTSKANPTASIWAARAALENKLGDKPSAVQSLTRALSIEPANIFALSEKIEIELAEGDFKSALTDAKNLVKADSGSINSSLTLARVQAAAGNSQEALKILDTLDRSNPKVTALRSTLAATDTTSIADLEKLLVDNPKNSTVLGQLCIATRVGDPQKSLAYCRSAFENEPDNINHAVGYSAALVQAKLYDQAIVVLKRIIQVTPDNYTAHANLAAAYFQSKRYPEAISEYNWITAKQPDLAVTYFFLGVAHQSLQEYLDAMANYQQFLKLAKPETNQLEIEKVNLVLPSLQRLIDKESKSKRRKK